jgi:hypothetical protein
MAACAPLPCVFTDAIGLDLSETGLHLFAAHTLCGSLFFFEREDQRRVAKSQSRSEDMEGSLHRLIWLPFGVFASLRSLRFTT